VNDPTLAATSDGAEHSATAATSPITTRLIMALPQPNAEIMRGCGHRSSCYYQRSALPTFAYYAVSMSTPRLRKPIRREDGRKSKAAADDSDVIDQTVESAMPPKKPGRHSVKHRLNTAVGRS